MPKAFDLQRLVITHGPNEKLDTALGKLPPLDATVFFDGLVALLKEVTGIDLSSPEAFVTSLIEVVTTGGPPALEFAAAMLNLIGGYIGIPNLGSFLPQLAFAFQGIDLEAGPGAIMAAIAQRVRSLLPSLLGRISIGALTAAPTNAFPLGNFPNRASIFDNPYWIWDGTVSRTADGTGSARRTLDGTEHKLVAADIVGVGAGQKVDLASAIRWTGVTATGTAFRFGIRTYLGDNVVSSFVEQQSISSPPAASTSYPGNSSGWVPLEKEWTVPSGVDGYKLVFIPTTAATVGIVWFDNGSGTQTGMLQLDWMPEAAQKFLQILGVFGSGGTVEQMQQAWENLLKVIGIDVPDDMLGDINLTAIWQGIATGKLKPLGVFATLIGGILPDSQKPQWLQDLTDGIGNLFNGSSDSDLGITNALASLGNIWGTGRSAQQSADNANIGVEIIKARLDPVGTVGYDEFDYASANTLPADKYALSSAGAGAGNYGPNGKGQLVWKPSGLAAREKVYKRTDLPLQTNNGVVTAVWSTKIKDPLFSDGYGYLNGRMFDDDNNTYVRARIDNNTAVIQAVVGGTVTTIGSSASIDASDGDVWEFWYGTLTNPYIFWLKQNGTVIPFGSNRYVEDTGHISQYGSNYLMCGVGGRADNYAGIFQIAPPTLNGWTWRDQNAAAVA